jgi:hypothetical protein
MKTIRFLLAVCLIYITGSVVLAQEETQPRYLLGNGTGKVYVSGFGAPIVGFSSMDGNFAVYTGGGGAVILNQTLYFGIYGMGLSTQHRYEDLTTDTGNGTITYNDLHTHFGHGGLWIGYLHNSHKAVHFGLSSKFGWGAASLASQDYDSEYDYYYHQVITDQVFVVQPMFEAEFNLLKWFKINTGIGYQFVTGIDKTYKDLAGNSVKYFDSKDFNQPVLNISFLFGGFGGKR